MSLEAITQAIHDKDPQRILVSLNEYYASLQNDPITDLDAVRGEHATKGLDSLFGFRHNPLLSLKQRLVELGVFSQDLAQYNSGDQERIVQRYLDNCSRKGHHGSEYLGKDLPERVLDTNRRVLAQSIAFKTYLADKGIIDLDAIRLEHATRGLGSLLGFKDSSPNMLKQRLADLEVFGVNLSYYDSLRRSVIVERLLHRSATHNPAWSSAYFNDGIDPSTHETNIGIVLGSDQVARFLTDQHAILGEPQTYSGPVRNLLRILRVEDSSLADLLANNGGVPPSSHTSPVGRTGRTSPAYRIIKTEWSLAEEDQLRGLVDHYGGLGNFPHIDAHLQHQYEESFGRSFDALIAKAERLEGIIRDSVGTDPERRVSYAFPPIHQ